MEDVELRVLHPVQQHVHAGQVVGGDVFFSAVSPAASPCGLAARDQNGDGGEDGGNLLRRVKLPLFVRPSGSLRPAISAALRFICLLAGPGGELADQVFIGITQRVDVRGELIQPFGDLLDDGAELGCTDLGMVLNTTPPLARFSSSRKCPRPLACTGFWLEMLAKSECPLPSFEKLQHIPEGIQNCERLDRTLAGNGRDDDSLRSKPSSN